MAITFRRTRNGDWALQGPTSELRLGPVQVEMKNGELTTRMVKRLGKPFTRDGVQMVYGYLDESGPTTQVDSQPAPSQESTPPQPEEVLPPVTDMALCASCYSALAEPGDTKCRSCGGVEQEASAPKPDPTPQAEPILGPEQLSKKVTVFDLLASAGELIIGRGQDDPEFIRGLAELIAATCGLCVSTHRAEIADEIERVANELESAR
jgi:hypothetical protein